MQNNFRVINEANQTLISKRTSLQRKITSLEKEVVNLRMTYPRGTTEPKKSVASPAQTVAGKDSSNPLMVVDLPKIQQTQGIVDFPTIQTQQNKSEQKEIWDTLGEPSGKYDYLVKYSSSAEQSSPDKEKEIMQDSQDPDDNIISIKKLLAQIQKLQDTPEKSKKFPRQKKEGHKKEKRRCRKEI
ncbi:Uncharacterized protein Adt_40579 [Abeliophyllum distichum]|uniref:Uncharacterized protein n=1 Tax=Abeliophyllum distichum TaxID=126358 RepID=A0ABD1Q899_9LAMI